VLSRKSDETQPNANRPSVTKRCTAAELAAKLAIAEICPKFNRCSAPYCPAVGGTHLQGERVCHYVRESVKPGGPARVRAVLPTPLADTVVMDALRLINSTGPIQKSLQRASAQGSRIVLMQQVAGKRRPQP
jgi:hypothetical protein